MRTDLGDALHVGPVLLVAGEIVVVGDVGSLDGEQVIALGLVVARGGSVPLLLRLLYRIRRGYLTN